MRARATRPSPMNKLRMRGILPPLPAASVVTGRYHRGMVRPDDIAAAVAALRAGRVIGLPTETVYGLAGRCLESRGRRDASSPSRAASHASGHRAHRRHRRRAALGARVSACRARPRRTLLAGAAHARPAAGDFGPLEVTGGQDTVALRVPAHPVALAVLQAFAGGLAAPSANRYGRISPTTAAHVREDLGDEVPVVLDGGPSPGGTRVHDRRVPRRQHHGAAPRAHRRRGHRGRRGPASPPRRRQHHVSLAASSRTTRLARRWSSSRQPPWRTPWPRTVVKGAGSPSSRQLPHRTPTRSRGSSRRQTRRRTDETSTRTSGHWTWPAPTSSSWPVRRRAPSGSRCTIA